MAQLAPAMILEGDPPRLIDEWQEVPPLWDAVRFAVDQQAEKGRFILTGSATPHHKGIMHSGAGRIARLRMRPMSLFESGDSAGVVVSLQKLCNGEMTPVMTGEVDLRDLIKPTAGRGICCSDYAAARLIGKIGIKENSDRDTRCILKRIEFRFPVFYKSREGYKIRLLNESTVETVASLHRIF